MLENIGNETVGLATVGRGTVRLAMVGVPEAMGAVDGIGKLHACSCDEVVDEIFSIALETN